MVLSDSFKFNIDETLAANPQNLYDNYCSINP